MRRGGLILISLILWGCAGTLPGPVGGLPRVAVLPFENIGGGAEAARTVTRICQSLLVPNKKIALVQAGDLEETLLRLRIRVPVVMTESQRDSLGAAMHCDYALMGSVLSFGEVSHPSAGRVGVVALTMQVMDMRSGRVVWSKSRSRQGSDGQWLFGLGVQRDPAVIAEALCRELIGQVHWNRLDR